MSIVMRGTNNTCKHLLQLTMFIENCLQGKYIFQCVDVALAANSKSFYRVSLPHPGVVASCRTALVNFIHGVSVNLVF